MYPPPIPVCLDVVAVNDILRDAARIREVLDRSGAVLLRDPSGTVVNSFACVTEAIVGPLFPGNGEHPAAEQEARHVYRPVLYDPREKLLWHHEDSFRAHFPHYIAFGCKKPADVGGETPLVDSHAVYSEIESIICEKFERLGILYERICVPGLGRSWSELYNTRSICEARQKAAAEGDHLQLLDDKNVKITYRRPAFRCNSSGRRVWFNQLTHWHPSCFSKALSSILSSFGTTLRDCRYGDGSSIEEDVVDVVLAAHQKHEIQFSWHAGDILLVDNTRFSHARNSYNGDRQHLVAMAKMTSY